MLQDGLLNMFKCMEPCEIEYKGSNIKYTIDVSRFKNVYFSINVYYYKQKKKLSLKRLILGILFYN